MPRCVGKAVITAGVRFQSFASVRFILKRAVGYFPLAVRALVNATTIINLGGLILPPPPLEECRGIAPLILWWLVSDISLDPGQQLVQRRQLDGGGKCPPRGRLVYLVGIFRPKNLKLAFGGDGE